MQICFKRNRTRERFNQIRGWHLKYVRFPRFYSFIEGEKCFIWLEYVQRRYKYNSYGLFRTHGSDGDWEYKSGRLT